MLKSVLHDPKMLPVMKKQHYMVVSVILCIVAMLSGCKGQPIAAPTLNAPVPLLSPTAVTSPTNTAVPTPTFQPIFTASSEPIPTPTPTPADTSVPKSSLERDCLKLSPSMPQGIKEDINLVFSGRAYLRDAYLLNLKQGDTIILEEKGEYIQNLDTSPSGKWLAFRRGTDTGDSEQLIIATGSGERVVRIPWDAKWRGISGWLDDERLWISVERPGYVNDRLVLFNPFTKEQTEFPGDYPDASDKFPRIGWGGFDSSAKVFDPTLSIVVYPSGVNRLILWDTITNTRISIIEGTISINGPPTWFQDGRSFIIKNDQSGELFLVSRDGIEKQLTHLHDYFPQFDIAPYSWSPDGRYIAFGLFVEGSHYPDDYPLVRQGGNTRLAILDLETNLVTDYCVPNHVSGAPIWLPNNYQLVVGNHPFMNEGRVYLVDLAARSVFEIAENAYQVGWLEAVPTTQP